jgi:predicted phage baseplate assembly protein
MVLLNTTMASHAVTSVNEILGSSNGGPGQRFRTSQAPVLEGQQLEVLERNELGEEQWFPWTRTGSFVPYGPLDRVYIFDYATGEVIFSDGTHGAIPPPRNANIRMQRYKTGGGLAGNREAHTITQLKTTVPYVDKVTNHQPAVGGAAAEQMEDLLHRGPRDLRHRGRAVTAEDYEDLALRSTSEVARAQCVPLVDLSRDRAEKRRTPGIVSLIIVPRAVEQASVPSLELLDRVRRYLEARRPPGIQVVLVGPDYLRVDVDVEIAVSDIEVARDTELGVKLALIEYLHPNTGRAGSGWAFGDQPKSSDLYAVVESIPGVDHVRSLQIRVQTDTVVSRRALIYAGEVQVAAVLES